MEIVEEKTDENQSHRHLQSEFPDHLLSLCHFQRSREAAESSVPHYGISITANRRGSERMGTAASIK